MKPVWTGFVNFVTTCVFTEIQKLKFLLEHIFAFRSKALGLKHYRIMLGKQA